MINLRAFPRNDIDSSSIQISPRDRFSPSSPTTIVAMDSTPHLDALKRDGYVLIKGLVSPDELPSLRRATQNVVALARDSKWPHIRTVPKQFPPWPSTPPPAEEGGLWGVQHLMHPEMPHRDEFAGLYFSDKVLSVVEEILGFKKDTTGREHEPLTMELLNLLIAPTIKDFALRWHRDDIPTPPTLSPEDELAQLHLKSPPDRPQSHAQYNIALYRDSSLIVVPGSHLRARTEEERNAGPFEDNMPGQKIVTMEPGDAVFYDSNIFHRGVYKGTPVPKFTEEEVEGIRMTIHGSVGLATTKLAEGKTASRATAVLQHGVGSWVKREDAAFTNLGPRAESMRQQLIKMGSGEDVGFSLEG